MKADIKQLWTDALRSGEYEQGYCGLRSKYNKLCCLGVLCELAAKAGVIKAAQIEIDGDWYDYGDGETMVLPEAVSRWAGLVSKSSYGDGMVPEQNPSVIVGDYSSSLADVNDRTEWLDKDGNIIEDIWEGHAGDYDPYNDPNVSQIRPNDFNRIADLIDASL